MPKPQEQRKNTRGQSPEAAADSGNAVGSDPAADVVDPVDRIRPYQWKKGQSGNPGGRPKGTSITARIRALLQTEHNGRQLMDLIAERLVKEALMGKFPYMKELMERIDGRVADKNEPQDNTVRIVVADARGNERQLSGLREYYAATCINPEKLP